MSLLMTGWSCACAHSAPGSSVPPSPAAEKTFMNARRCNMAGASRRNKPVYGNTGCQQYRNREKGHPGRDCFRRQLDVLFTAIRGGVWRKDENESTQICAPEHGNFSRFADRGKCRAIAGPIGAAEARQRYGAEGIRHQTQTLSRIGFLSWADRSRTNAQYRRHP